MPGAGTILKRASGPVGVAMDLLESPDVMANEAEAVMAAMKKDVLSRIKDINPSKLTEKTVIKAIGDSGIGGVDAEDLLDDIMVSAKTAGDEGFDVAKKLAIKSGADTTVLKKPKTMGEIPLESTSFMKKLGGVIKRNPLQTALTGFAGLAVLNALFKTDWSKDEKIEESRAVAVDQEDKPYSMEELEALRDKAFGVEDPVVKAIERLQKVLRRKRK